MIERWNKLGKKEKIAFIVCFPLIAPVVILMLIGWALVTAMETAAELFDI